MFREEYLLETAGGFLFFQVFQGPKSKGHGLDAILPSGMTNRPQLGGNESAAVHFWRTLGGLSKRQLDYPGTIILAPMWGHSQFN